MVIFVKQIVSNVVILVPNENKNICKLYIWSSDFEQMLLKNI